MPVADGGSRLRQFIALQQDALLILGPRRHPPVPARTANTNTSIAIQTSIGFSTLESDEYVEAARKLRPDTILGLADYEYLKRPGVKRLEKMGDRTLAWTQDMLAGLRADADEPSDIAFFAPILPIDSGQQSYYLETLKEDLADQVSGWILFDAASVDAIPQGMRHLPRFGLTAIRGPHDILNQISLGIDVFIPSFIGEATDAGIALTFAFSGLQRPQDGQRLALGVDMWSQTYMTDLAPLVEGCRCYTCTNHHRAFIRHLLDAKEMLAWVLLQVHNHHMLDIFFHDARESISRGTFEGDCNLFEEIYEVALPASAGQGPRLRGYQVKSGASQPPRNPQAYRPLEDATERLADAPLPSPGVDCEQLEVLGFAEKLG